ncbi:MAG: TetR/AcrR family transcriptional regulator [Planctomycetota bacterium]|nr:MAG: TetR/AcrR family transcriptional regulator [Planctomycetota bacterium]
MARKKTSWQRARQPEQKEERRAAILQAAASLLDENGLEETGLNAIAREAGISKANIYRYFESREAILLHLLLEEVDSWAHVFQRRLRRLAGTGDVDAISKAFAETIAKRRRFCALIGALATVLEHNVGPDTVIAFKREFLAAVKPAVSALGTALPAFSTDQASSCLAMLIMAASGAWPHCHPAPVVEQVLAKPEFASMRLDFKRTMRDYAAALLRGLQDS